MQKIQAREYKVMLYAPGFVQAGDAVAELGEELQGLARSLDLEIKGSFEATDRRWIVFLDTLDHELYRASMILRQRRPRKKGNTEFTLKAMSPDPCIARAFDVHPAKRKTSNTKFEEDIGAPFRPRFSHSTTIEVGSVGGIDEEVRSIGTAAEFFPSVGEVQANGRVVDPSLALRPVNGLRAFETVFKGPEIVLGGVKATAAVIIWTQRPKGRPLVAEFSFRYRVRGGEIRECTARHAYDFHAAVQRMDWCRPDSMTKTQYVYRAEANV